MTPFGCGGLDNRNYPYGLNGPPDSVRSERSVRELPDPVEHVGGVESSAGMVDPQNEDRRLTAEPMRDLATHPAEVAAADLVFVRRVAAGEVSGDVDHPDTSIVVGRVEHAVGLIDGKVVWPRTIEVKEGNLARRG